MDDSPDPSQQLFSLGIPYPPGYAFPLPLEKREGMKELIAYVKSNWEGIVDYCQMQKDGYLISSTLVENAANLVVAKRQKRKHGMRWIRSGADSLCALRTLWLNGDWEDYWKQRCRRSA